MSLFVQAVDDFGLSRPNTVAFANSAGETITYGELKRASDALAHHLAALDDARRPVVVYGHKSPLMIACFHACSKSGRAYVPVDIVYPTLRVADIMDQLGAPIVLNTTQADLQADFAGHMGDYLGVSDIEQIAASADEASNEPAEASQAATAPVMAQVEGDDTFYILFTSGSTGRPKGVEVTAECVDNFWKWMVAEFPGTSGAPGADPAAADSPRRARVLFNRAPFSFDLSMTDIALGLGAGDTMFALSEDDEASLAKTFEALSRAGIDFWCSTASFADMCLRDPAFNRELLPRVRMFFFVGETLKNETAAKLLERFDGAEVVNGYGPTESTDLVTAVRITREMCESPDPLPVGTPMPGCELHILDPDTLAPVPAGEYGELFIVGNTVAKGYFGREDLTRAAFHSCPEDIARGRRSYRTGDAAMVDEAGMLHFRGRLDFQVKLHGFRVELGEIESALRALEGVQDACVLPVERRGSISHLAACVAIGEAAVPAATGDSAAPGEALSPGAARNAAPDEFDRAQALKDALARTLPEYMIPRKIVFLRELPLNVNGKIDRKKLGELI